MLKKLNTEEFIAKAIAVRGDKYDYSKVVYTTTHEHVVIICKEHGEFKQIPSGHLRGVDCPSCMGVKKVTTEEFIGRAKEVHGELYDYSKTEVKAVSKKVTITCQKHGDFQQVVNNHLQGKGCPTCGKTGKLNNSTFIARSKEVHGDRYDYSKVDYIDAKTHVIINCVEHGEFKQAPHKHLIGQGCPKCSSSGFNDNKPAILYYLSVLGGTAYKIGITNRSVEERFDREDAIYTIVKTWEYQTGIDARIKEAEILKEFTSSRYTGPNLLKSGNTELFNRDVLMLDTQIK